MAEWNDKGHVLSMKAAADLRTLQYHFVCTNGTVDQVTIATEPGSQNLLGVLWNKPNTNEHASVVVGTGEAKVVAGGALSLDALITTTTSGRAAAATSGDYIVGKVLEASGADGDIIRCLIHPPYRMFS